MRMIVFANLLQLLVTEESRVDLSTRGSTELMLDGSLTCMVPVAARIRWLALSCLPCPPCCLAAPPFTAWSRLHRHQGPIWPNARCAWPRCRLHTLPRFHPLVHPNPLQLWLPSSAKPEAFGRAGSLPLQAQPWLPALRQSPSVPAISIVITAITAHANDH